MTLRQRGIVEILSRIAAHPEPFHYGARTDVRRGCVSDDFRERESPKPVAKRQSGRLRRITVSPMLIGEAPADLHAGREMRAQSRIRQSGEADKTGDAGNLDRLQPKSVFAKMLLDAVNHRVALGTVEAAAEEFHHPRIGIHGGKRFPIRLTPSTQAHAPAGQCRKSAHRCAIPVKPAPIDLATARIAATDCISIGCVRR